MNCTDCQTPVTIKNTERFVSILCNCGITIIYPNKLIKNISKKDYDPSYKNKRREIKMNENEKIKGSVTTCQ